MTAAKTLQTLNLQRKLHRKHSLHLTKELSLWLKRVEVMTQKLHVSELEEGWRHLARRGTTAMEVSVV